jgi:hypothetical protein
MDHDKYVSYKQAFTAMLAAAGIFITIGLSVGVSIWGHEKSQDEAIHANKASANEAIRLSNNVKEDVSEIKTLIKTQNQINTDTRERVIIINEKLK